MQIDIQIRGPRGSGKTLLANELADFLKERLAAKATPKFHTVEIKCGLVPDPRGLELEHKFNA